MSKASSVVAILMTGFLLAACGFAQASAITSYTDAAAFGAASGSLTTIDFQSILGPGVVGADYNNQILSVGPINFNGITTDLLKNASFSTLSITNYAGYDTFGPGNPTAVVGGAVANTTDTQYSGQLSADLASYSTAVGFYVGMTNPTDAGSFTIDVKTADGQTHTFSASSTGGVGSFIGFTSDSAITGIDINSTPSDLSAANQTNTQNNTGTEANIALGDFSYNSPSEQIDAAPL
ncbi:MAG TPA: hypothetical protein VFW23_09460, partial [Tepidisphaeraceae bacterium]|nr:hypothetical protein [Tepidisphaeraceae bacterium]